MKLLFVCTGNTCRSSMAEGLAREILVNKNQTGIDVSSAGTFALPGDPAADQAIQTLKEKGIDIQNHRATLLTPALVEQADLVLTMTASHRMQVLSMVPTAEDKVYTLGNYAGIFGDIADPFGQPLEVYIACAEQMKQIIAIALDKMLKNAGKNKNM